MAMHHAHCTKYSPDCMSNNLFEFVEPSMPTSPASSTDTISVAHCDAALATAPADQKSVTSGQASTSAETAPWALQLSSSFTSIADQLAVASQALYQVPASSPAHPTQPHNDSAQSASPTALAAFASRLDTIEQMQASLSAEINKIKATALDQKGSEIQTEQTTAASVEDLDKKISALQESLKLDQDRLYARLHNTTANVSKMSILALPAANGKPPPNFPATKGEFEHLTKERYEALLKAYGQPIKGDTNAKREALRVFIGLPA